MKFDEWVDQLRAELPLQDIIQIASAKMQDAHGESLRNFALGLKWLLVEAGRDLEALAMLDEMIVQFPDDVLLSISRASLYFYYLERPQDALRSIDFALERAYRSGFFRREALGVKARILLQLGRGEQLSDVLEQIMALQIIKDIPDVGRERDFVDRAPAGLIRADVLARYNQFRPKRPGDTTADGPPEYEPPDDADVPRVPAER